MQAALPSNEAERLTVLRQLNLLDTPRDPNFDMMAKLAAYALKTPISAFSLVDQDRQWFKASEGLDVCSTPRDQAFCAHTILEDAPLVVNDTHNDRRFFDNPLVTGEPFIRAYLGVPIVVSNNIRIGTICVIDTVPRKFTTADVEAVETFAKLIKSRLDLMLIQVQAHEDAEKLRAANLLADRARVVLDNMSEGLVLQERGGAIIQANPSACRVLGLTLEQMLGRDSVDPGWRSVTEAGEDFPGDQHPAMITLATGKALSEQVFGVHTPDGALRWLRVNTVPLFEDEQPLPSHVIATFSDITSSKETEAELRRLSDDSKAANSAKTAFLANMSHEIRTPLNGVVGIAGALARTNLQPRQADMVELIRTSGRTLERLLGDILDLSKVEAGQVELELAPFNLINEIEAAANLLRVRADEKGLQFSVSYSPELAPTYVGDAVRLRQIVSNLASNAIKFTAVGKVDVVVRSGTGQKVEIEVADTGIGFEINDIERLFSRFTQADVSITRRFGGSGLGLSITHGLIQLMGGTIATRSTQGQGSVFTVCLPLVQLDSTEAKPTEPDTRPILQPMRDLNILLVEDNTTNQRVFEIMLEPLGLKPSIVNNGAEGVEAFATAHYDVIFMDMQMPVMDGLAATREIRAQERAANRSRTPIVMLTANATKGHRREALEAGADLHLTKPVTIESLYEAMEICLA